MKTSEEQIHKEGHKRKEQERSRGRGTQRYLVDLLNIAVFTCGEASHLEKESVWKFWFLEFQWKESRHAKLSYVLQS